LTIGGKEGNDIRSIAHSRSVNNKVVLPFVDRHGQLFNEPGSHIKDSDLRLLGRTHPGQQVVMLTGRVDETTKKTALELGATLYLEKPTTAAGFQALYAALEDRFFGACLC